MTTLGSWGVFLLAWLPAALAASAAPKAAPDLTVSSMEIRDRGRQALITPTSGREISIYVDVRNASMENAPDVGLRCDYAGGVNIIRTGAISANTTKRLVSNLPVATTTGPARMSCEVDPDGLLLESNENNNRMFKDFTIEANRATDFRVELRNFQPWTVGSMGHRTMAFDVANMTPRGAALPVPAGVPARLRWQISCTVMQAPFLKVRETNNLTRYGGGDLPAAGATQRTSVWIDGFTTSTPTPSSLPPELDLMCKVTSGAFLPNVPILHSGDSAPQLDWGPAPEWWTANLQFKIPNPESQAYTDVVLGSVSGSASANSALPPRSDMPTYGRFSVASVPLGTPVLEVSCSATRAGAAAVTAAASFNNPGNTVTGAVNFGTLPDGGYALRCVADPNRRIAEADVNNNVRTASVTVFTPGPDLIVQNVEVRDQDRQSLITPTAGRDINVYVEVKNQSGENAADADLTCRHAAGVMAVRTGALAAGASKRLVVAFPATTQTGAMRMNCEIDEANVIREISETNNARYVDYTIEPNRTTDFRIELRNFQPWTKDGTGHRSVAFDVVNTSPRGAALPVPSGIVARLRWQIICTVMQAPFLKVRSAGNMTLYPGGDLPPAGTTQRVSLWIDGFTTSWPPASDFPAQLDLACKVTTGAFMPNLPVIHTGDSGPQLDWVPGPEWWTINLVYKIPNPEAK